MKQPFEEEGHAPEGTYPRSLWTEPSFEEALGSCAPSLAVRIRFSDDAKRLIIRVKRCTNSNSADDRSPGKEKAREQSEQELGASEASIGGRAQWVKRSAQAQAPNDIAERCGGGGGKECSPSAGWREVAHDMHATEGVSHR